MNFLQNLQLREKILVLGAAVAIVITLLYTLAIDPLLSQSIRLDRQIRKAQKDLRDMQTHRRAYIQQELVLKSVNAQINQQRNFSIISRLDVLARNTGTHDKVQGMKPVPSPLSEAYTENAVQIKMADVTLEQLQQYLYAVEQSPQFLKIKRLSIKPRQNNRQLLSATFRVSAFTPKDS